MSKDCQSLSEVRVLLPQAAHGPRIGDRLCVTLGQQALPVGELRTHVSGEEAFSEFRYSATWLKHSRFFPVSPDLRRTRSSQWRKPPRIGGHNIFAGLADSVPTGFALSVVRRATERGLLDPFRLPGTEPGPMDALCAVLDTGRLGALRIHPSSASPADTKTEERLLPRRSDLQAIADAVAAFERGQEDERQLLLLLYCATALGGSRPKCTYVQDDGRLGVAKFPSVVDSCTINRVEVLTMHLAKAAGIKVVDVSLMHPVSAPFAVAARFDRAANGERRGFLSARSFVLAEAHEVVDHFDLLDAMRIHCKDFVADACQLWRRLALDLLINAADGDLRKIGFLYAGQGRWSLAPAHGTRPQLNSAPSRQFRSTKEERDDALEALVKRSTAFGINPSDALALLRNQGEAIGRWRKLASQFNVNISNEDVEMFKLATQN